VALTESERLMVFEIFGFPPNHEVIEMWGPVGRANAVQKYSFRSPSEAVDTLIGYLTTDQEAVVSGLVVEWVEVRTSEIELKKAETVSGVVSSASTKRMLIRTRLQVHIPLYLDGELDRIQQNRGGRGGSFARG
jgi:hypothetical protein